MEETVDSGMSAEAVERAEWAWANLPVGPRKWTSLTTAEKALVCHITERLTAEQANAAMTYPADRVTPIDGDNHRHPPRWNEEIEALQARVAELEAGVRKARDEFASAAQVPLADPYILIELRALCERAGYGNVMSSASALWRERLGDLAGGEFVCGPCRATAENHVTRLDALLNKGSEPCPK